MIFVRKINDHLSHSLHYVADDGTTFGQFYNSWDKKYHLAEYVPYDTPPQRYLCGGNGNFSPSRCDDKTRKMCTDCFNLLEQASRLQQVKA